MDDDCELRMITAANPLLVLVVKADPQGGLDVFIDGLMPEFLRPGALRALATDIEQGRLTSASQN